MKARNPSTGNLEEVYVKALDSLPVGSEIDFDGSASDIPVGWEQINPVYGIVESGTNTNGSYVKYDDGTMICYGKKSVILNVDQAWGSLFVSSANTFNFNNFPVAFISVPIITYSLVDNTTETAFGFILSDNDASSTHLSATSPGAIRFGRGTTASNAPYSAQYIAIGKWK